MLQPRISSRQLLIALLAVAILGLVTVPASGAEPANPQAVPQSAPTGAAAAGSLPGLAASGCQPGPNFSAIVAPLTPAKALPAGQAPAWGGGRFHGFCPCGCSGIPDCNTSADCFGGAQCMTAPSCC